MYRKILIVDDELLEAKCLANAIEWEKYNLFVSSCVSSAAAALKEIESGNIDVVISDIRMPKMSGIELCEIVREQYPDIVFIFLSAFKDFEYARAAITQRVFDYITKPLDFEQLEKLCINLSNHFKASATDYPPISTKTLHMQQLMSDFLLGKIKTSHNLASLLEEKELVMKYTPGKCAHVTVNIHKFMEFLTDGWGYGTDKAYAYITNSLKSRNLIIIPFSYTFDRIDFIVLALCNHSFNSDLEKACSAAEFTCISDISLKISANIVTYFNIPEDLRQSVLTQQVLPENDSNPNSSIISTALEYIEGNYMNDISLFDIAQHVELTPYYFSRIFKKETGNNFSVYLTDIRISHAKKLLKETDIKNSEVSKLVGISNTNYFYSLFKSHTGYTPVEFRGLYQNKKD